MNYQNKIIGRLKYNDLSYDQAILMASLVFI